MKQIKYTPISKGVLQSEETASKDMQSSGYENPVREGQPARNNWQDEESLDLEEQLVSALYLVQTKNDNRETVHRNSGEHQRRSGERQNSPEGQQRRVRERQSSSEGQRRTKERQSSSESRKQTRERQSSSESQRRTGERQNFSETSRRTRDRQASSENQQRAGERQISSENSRRDNRRKIFQEISEREEREREREREQATSNIRRKRAKADWNREMPLRRGRRKRNPLPVLIACMCFVFLLGIGGWFYVYSQAYKVCRVEAGVEVKPSDFLKKPDEKAVFAKGSEEFDISVPGEYHIKVKSGLFTHSSTLIVEDTVAPQAQPVDVQVEEGTPCEAEEFVTDIVDATEVAVSFVLAPDFSTVGTQTVQVALTDKGNNQTIIKAELTVIPLDREPPQIIGAEDITIFAGDSVSYKKNVTVEDNFSEDVELEVDASAVNLNEAGTYPVIYSATDAAGNTTSVTVNITVKPRAHGIDEVNALADKVLSQIIKPDMSLEQKARAIFDYNKSHIGYINSSDKSDWVKAAYEGLALGKGDCYVYACTAKALLTRAGIPNMDIEKIPTDTLHYWNLVDVGGGWYHFDTTPRVDHPVIYMWTDEQLMAYSQSHKNCHNYDHSAYPKVN